MPPDTLIEISHNTGVLSVIVLFVSASTGFSYGLPLSIIADEDEEGAIAFLSVINICLFCFITFGILGLRLLGNLVGVIIMEIIIAIVSGVLLYKCPELLSVIIFCTPIIFSVIIFLPIIQNATQLALLIFLSIIGVMIEIFLGSKA